MSVNHHYYSLDWSRIPEINRHGTFEFLFDILEEEKSMPAWISELTFGNQVDDYFFSSWVGLMDFRDWLDEAEPLIHSDTVQTFSSIFQDVGLLMNDQFAFIPIKDDITFEDEWLLGAIPPTKVRDLVERSNQIDLIALSQAFQEALDRHASEIIESGEWVKDWFEALKEGLIAVERKGFGIILGAA